MRPFDNHERRIKAKLSIYEEIILDLIDLRGQTPVMEVIEIAEEHRVACLATLHRALKSLEENKYINVKVDGGDNRKRTCSIAQRGTIYLKHFQ